MQSPTIRCDACGRDAVIHRIQYTYSVDGPPGQLADKHVLREIQRDVECPHCGLHTKIEIPVSEGE